jgi:hypothetical protein
VLVESAMSSFHVWMLEISPLAMDTNVSDFLGDMFSYDLLEHHGKI